MDVSEADRATVAELLLVDLLDDLVQFCESAGTAFLEELHVTLPAIGAEVQEYTLSSFRQEELFLPSTLVALHFANPTFDVPAFTRTILGLHTHHVDFEGCPDGTVCIEDHWPTRVPDEETSRKIELGWASDDRELIGCHTTTPLI